MFFFALRESTLDDLFLHLQPHSPAEKLELINGAIEVYNQYQDWLGKQRVNLFTMREYIIGHALIVGGYIIFQGPGSLENKHYNYYI